MKTIKEAVDGYSSGSIENVEKDSIMLISEGPGEKQEDKT
jgi:hypothetical protein